MIVTALVIGGIVVGSLLIAGCSDDDQEDQDLAGVPFKGDVATEPEPEPEAFVKGEDYRRVDDRSFELYNYLWEDVASAHLGVWRPRERMYIGAATDLFKPIYEERIAQEEGAPDAGVALDPVVKQYGEAVTESFFSYYRNRPGSENPPLEESILVLIGGLAPTREADMRVIEGALDALGRMSPGNDDFVTLLKAGAHFNRAADLVSATDRYSGPRAASDATDEAKDDAREILEGSFYPALLGVNRDNLDDRQIEYYIALEGAAKGLGDSLKQAEPEQPQDGNRGAKWTKRRGGKKRGGGKVAKTPSKAPPKGPPITTAWD